MRSETKLLFISGAIAGIFIWLQLYFPLLKQWTAIVIFTGFLALIIKLITKLPNKIILLIVPGGFMGAYIIKVIIDVISDPTSHNLLPIEIILLSIIIVLAVLIGLGIGMLIKVITGKFSQPRSK
jgi:hypothetical protein